MPYHWISPAFHLVNIASVVAKRNANGLEHFDARATAPRVDDREWRILLARFNEQSLRTSLRKSNRANRGGGWLFALTFPFESCDSGAGILWKIQRLKGVFLGNTVTNYKLIASRFFVASKIKVCKKIHVTKTIICLCTFFLCIIWYLFYQLIFHPIWHFYLFRIYPILHFYLFSIYCNYYQFLHLSITLHSLYNCYYISLFIYYFAFIILL